MYKFSVYDFSEKEIDQIVVLFKRYCSGSTMPIDRRKVSRQVVEWGLNWGLLARGENLKNYQNETPWYVKERGLNRVYFTRGVCSPKWALPVEALWRLVENMVKEHSGFSITKNPGWYQLNIYPATNGSHSDRDLGEMFEIFVHLDMWGYIRFSAAGSCWQIIETPERTVRSE